MKTTNDYVDNKALLAYIKEWQAKRQVDPDTPLSNPIGKAIMDIAYNLTRRWNFSGYTADWKEQMVGDAVETSVKYIKNFDTENYSNPHAYITTICFRAFQNRIKRERKESVVKYKYFVEEVFDHDDADMSAQVDMDFYQDMVNKIADYDRHKKKTEKVDSEPDADVLSVGLGKIYGNDF